MFCQKFVTALFPQVETRRYVGHCLVHHKTTDLYLFQSQLDQTISV
jgi:hypothetical protein